jgi:hypothetical protein
MDNQKNITLQFPVKANGVLLTELTIRRPKVKDRLAAAKAAASEDEQEIYLIATLAGIAPSDVHEMDLLDYETAQDALLGFMGRSRSTSSRR